MKKEKWTAAQIIDALKESQGMVYVAARKLGCHHQTIYNYANRYAKVQSAIDAERGHFLDTTELALKRAVLNGEGWAVCFALKTLGKDRGYVERHQVEHSGKIDVTKLSDEELAAEKAAIIAEIAGN
jgi:hypothetical protein